VFLGLCVSASMTSALPVHADNPMVQTNYTADPAPMVYGERVYVYTSHDEDETVNNFFTMNDWRCYSSADMTNWTDHGSPLSYRDFAWSSGDAWAGQVVHREGTFFFYVPLTHSSTNRKVIGVAVADNPLGPFVDPLGAPLIADSYDIDPTVFVDEDGHAYLYWGNPDLMYVRLNPDMISYSGEIQRVPMTTESFGSRSGDPERPTLYEEGPWFYRRGELYYLIYATDCCSPEKIDYSTSTTPTGPWVYRGRIMDSAGSRSFTNHPGVIDFQGHTYLFYHNGALPGGGGFRRSVGVEEFSYNADGTLPTIPMTEDGPAPLKHLDPFVQTEAETIAFSSGLKTEACSEGGMNVTSIDDGDYIKVEDVDFGAGITSFSARVAAASSCGAIEVHLDSLTGPMVGSCPVSNTGGAQAWQTQTCQMEGASGVHDVFFRFLGGCNLFGFNWWKFDGPGEEANSSSETGGDVGGSESSGSGASVGEPTETSGASETTGSDATDAHTPPSSTVEPSTAAATHTECMQTCDDTAEGTTGTSESSASGASGADEGDAEDATGTGSGGGRPNRGCSCRAGERGAESPVPLAMLLTCLVWRRRVSRWRGHFVGGGERRFARGGVAKQSLLRWKSQCSYSLHR